MKIPAPGSAIAAVLIGAFPLIPSAVTAAPAVTRPTATTSVEKPKLLLLNGNIRTPAGVVAALAVNDRGVITALGTDAQLQSLKTQAARVIDLQGRTVLPGFDDQHVHPVFAGLQAHRCVIPQGANLRSLQEHLRECARRAAPGAWITGGQWDAPALGAPMERSQLDAVSADHPVLLGDTSEHSAWANSRALQIAGVDRSTANPQSGIIERNAAGELTGVLREAAVPLVRQHVPAPTSTEIEAALTSSTRIMLSYGITSFTEAAVGYSAGLEKEVGAYVALTDSGALSQRIRVCITWSPGDASAEQFIAQHNLYTRDRLSVDCVKIFLDGVPTDSHTAAMLEPYVGKVVGRADETSEKGMLLVPQNVLNDAVTRFDALGLAVKFHAAGDAAVRAGLNAIEAARKRNGFSGVLHDVGHCTFVSRDDIPRARKIGATFEVSPYLWSPSPINDSIAEAVGPRTIQRVWPVREMLDAGALVVPGSDWSVVPSVNPWGAIEALVTRERPGGSADSFGKAEAITVKEALDLFTVNAARHLHQEGRLGRVAVGMLADLVVLDQDPLTIAAGRLHTVKVLKTIINGDLVFDSAPERLPGRP